MLILQQLTEIVVSVLGSGYTTRQRCVQRLLFVSSIVGGGTTAKQFKRHDEMNTALSHKCIKSCLVMQDVILYVWHINRARSSNSWHHCA